MKNIISIVSEKEDKVMKTANTVNHEGEKAWKMSDSERLMQYAMTGVLGNTFYVSQKDLIDDAVDLIKRATPEELSKAIVIGRNIGYIRAFPILGLVYLSMKSPELFKKSFNCVIYTGDDLENFIDLTRGIRGFGRSIKNSINKWLKEKTTPYYALKYRKALSDAIRLARPQDNNPIYAYILRGKTDVSKENLKVALEKHPEFVAFESIPELLKEGKLDKVRDNIVGYRLDVDSLTAYYDRFDKNIWDAIAKNSPVMRFLKYLNKFERSGVDVCEYAKQKITVDNLRSARVFPFRLFTTWKNLSASNQKVADVLSNVLDDYIQKYDWGKFNQKTWAICPDVSGSMRNSISARGNARISVIPLDICSMFTGFLAKGVSDAIILPWASSLREYLPKKEDSVLKHMDFIKRLGGGGTNMNCALDYLMENKINRDYCVFITDTESYQTTSTNGSRESWIKTWIKYKEQNPNAIAFIIRCDEYEQNPMSDEHCKKYGIYQIFGWNDSVITFIQNIVENS